MLHHELSPNECTKAASAAHEIVRAVAHDLRSPICALRGFLRLLQREHGARLDERGHAYLDRMAATVDRMDTLIDELLALGVESDSGSRRSHVESREVCLQVAADFKTSLDERGIRLILPPAPPAVYTVRTQLFRVLSNLVSNAVRHMGATRDPWIRVDLTRAEGGVELRVSDNGRGLPPSVRDRIFEEPAWDPMRRPSAPGGLGLAIVKRIAEAHGGWVEAESPPGLGATFRVFFPDRRS